MKKYLFILCLLPLAFPAAARAAYTNDGVEIEPIYFGQIVIVSNSSAQSCTLPAGGTMTCTSGIQILHTGQYGVFRLSNYDPSVAIWASIASSPALTGPDSSTFSIGSFTFAPDIGSIGTEEAPPGGTLTLYIGATLTTTAGATYSLAPYRGTYTLQINY
ncbi:MAG: DUF4402 domain-containing protein [Alphaproteobacteria bacterium]|nr:DUF4402 domain-containing protein [Alphaproteobacteria bacterium]MDE2336406.1 DUF4402 domain-containing protein [Alphaproteobacteria bacterium]